VNHGSLTLNKSEVNGNTAAGSGPFASGGRGWAGKQVGGRDPTFEFVGAQPTSFFDSEFAEQGNVGQRSCEPDDPDVGSTRARW
jgi:hypothetical protein